MVVGGCIDIAGGAALLVSLGDSRLRLWDRAGGEVTGTLLAPPATARRWSTKRGVIGELPPPRILRLDDAVDPSLGRVAAYSDGLARLDDEAAPPGDTALAAIVAATASAPASDDCCLIDVILTAPEPIAPARIAREQERPCTSS